MGKVSAEIQCLVGAAIAAIGLYCFSAIDGAESRVAFECIFYITEQGRMECEDAQFMLGMYQLCGPVCSILGAVIAILGLVEYSKASDATKVVGVTTVSPIAVTPQPQSTTTASEIMGSETMVETTGKRVEDRSNESMNELIFWIKIGIFCITGSLLLIAMMVRRIPFAL